MKKSHIIWIILASLAAWYWFNNLNLILLEIRHNTPIIENQKSWWLLYGYIALLLGVLFGLLITELLRIEKKNSEDIDISIHIKNSLRRVDLWVAIFASPIIYGCVINMIPLPVIQYLYFALQTGFCSYMIIRVCLQL